MKKNIAIIAGGLSAERDISLLSAKAIKKYLDRNLFNPFIVEINEYGWYVQIPGHWHPLILMNDLSFYNKGKNFEFDYVYNTVHGSPGEDGKLQGFLDMIKKPHSSCGTAAAALTFNKYFCNQYLKSQGIRVAEAVRYHRTGDANPDEELLKLLPEIARLGMPLFVKPTESGSSFGVSKVETEAQLSAALHTALQISDEVMFERAWTGREVSCGCYRADGRVHTLPVTEIVSNNSFFDYEAKYKGMSQEITPAHLPDDVTHRVQQLTARVYELVNARGIVRIDYIITDDGEPAFLEINTNPGMTDASIVPQQIRAANLNIKDVLTKIIHETLNFSNINNTNL